MENTGQPGHRRQEPAADRQLWLPTVRAEFAGSSRFSFLYLCTGGQQELKKQQWRHDCQQKQSKVGHHGCFGEVDRRPGTHSLLSSNVPVTATSSAGRYPATIASIDGRRHHGSNISSHLGSHTQTHDATPLRSLLQHTGRGSAHEGLCIGHQNHLHLHYSESHGQSLPSRRILVQEMTRRSSNTVAENDHHHRQRCSKINNNNCLLTAPHPVGWIFERPPSPEGFY